MTQTLESFLNGAKNKEFAIHTGTEIHAALQQIVIDEPNKNIKAQEFVDIILKRPDLKPFFSKKAKTDVPIAGIVNGIFVSRRIDRLLINHDTKTIDFIDYKTDTDKTAFITQYKHQLQEYNELLGSAYPNYKINAYILWLHDWSLERL